MIETIVNLTNLIPYFFIIIHLFGLWASKEDTKEIKHVVYIIMWLVILVGYKIAKM